MKKRNIRPRCANCGKRTWGNRTFCRSCSDRFNRRARGYAAALEYATRLAKGMWERDWQEESPNWQPLDDLLGVMTQIDNMLAGMEKKKRHNDKLSHGPVRKDNHE